MVRSYAVIAALMLIPALAGCDLGGAGERADQAAAVAASVTAQADPRLPQGFTIASGRGGVRDLSVSDGPDGGVAVAYATIASPRAIMAYYAREAGAVRMAAAGTMDAGDQLSANFELEGNRPNKLSVTATQKGQFTNVTLMFDMS